jgi:hypothetical protein
MSIINFTSFTPQITGFSCARCRRKPLRVEVAYRLPLMNPTTFIAALKRKNEVENAIRFSTQQGK